MAKDRIIGFIFKYHHKNNITLLDNRSRIRFQRLINEFAKDSGYYLLENEEINDGDNFSFIQLVTILNELEDRYQVLEKNIATRRAAKNAFKLIDEIKTINNITFDSNRIVSSDDDE